MKFKVDINVGGVLYEKGTDVYGVPGDVLEKLKTNNHVDDCVKNEPYTTSQLKKIKKDELINMAKALNVEFDEENTTCEALIDKLINAGASPLDNQSGE